MTLISHLLSIMIGTAYEAEVISTRILAELCGNEPMKCLIDGQLGWKQIRLK